MPTQQTQEYFTSQEYMYKNSNWNPNTKEFYYVPTYSSQSNEILANQVSEQTWYERQKGAENRFIILSNIGELISKSKNPLLFNIGTSLDYGGKLMKYGVTPDDIKYNELFNDLSPKK